MSQVGKFKLFNTDRANAMIGGMPSEFDHAVVYDTTKTIPNALTGKPQPAIVFSGTLAEAWAFIKDNS